MSRLQELRLNGCAQLDLAGIEAIGRLATLEQLDLGFCTRKKIFERGDGLEPLGDLPALEVLLLPQTAAAFEGHACLSRMRALRRLDLCVASDRELDPLRSHPTLEDLVILHQATMDVGLTDEGLGRLHGLPRLRRLDVSGCWGVTVAGLEALLNATPSLRELDAPRRLERTPLLDLVRRGPLDRLD